MYDESMSGTNFYTIPNVPEMRNDLLSVDRMTKEGLRERHRLYLQNDWESNTVTTAVVETIIGVLYSHIKDNGVSVLSEKDSTYLNFYDLIVLSATNKQNEDAEKTGNINVKFAPGSMVDEIVSDDIPDDQKEVVFIAADAAYSYPDDMERTEAMVKIDRIARKKLADKNSIILPKDYCAIACANIFIENIYRHLVSKMVSLNKSSVSVNFNDLIEFHATKKEDGIEIRLRPGMGAKLIIKSDESTEDDDDDDEY